MFFKKQIVLVVFFLAIILVVLYKKNQTNSFKEGAFLVNVDIIDVYCSTIGKKNYSRVTFKYKEKIYKQSISEKKCNKLSNKTRFEIYYNERTKSFLLPELLEENYFNKILIFLFIILIISLIPYRKLIKI